MPIEKPSEELSRPRQRKVLVSAFEFNPARGSECATGWNYIRAIALKHRVWVITRSNERADTDLYLRQHPELLRSLSVHYVPWTRRSFNFPLGQVPYYLLYRLWQWRAYRLGRALDAQVDFDLVHHVNGTGFREPGYLWKIPKPFVWGPVNGLQFFPLRLLRAVPLRSRGFFALKNLTTLWAMYIARRPRRAATAARAIIAGSVTTAERIRILWRRRSVVLSEVSTPDSHPGPPARRQPGEPLRILWCGRCVPGKALNIVLLALRQLRHASVSWQFIAVGGGPLQDRWHDLAEKSGIGSRCTFTGSLSRSDVFSMLSSGHCLVQPSLYDATSTVIAEALAFGLPVICLDHFGFKDAVSAECGIRIPPDSLPQIIRGFADAIQVLANDEERRYAMALAAQKSASLLSWKYKAQVIDDIYSQVLPQDAPAPGKALPSSKGALGFSHS